MNAWIMAEEEREALWAENDKLYRFTGEDPWDVARDIIEEKHRIEGPSLVDDYCFCCPESEWAEEEASWYEEAEG